jgi:membrane-bound lytic murein transglycosylase D
VAPFPIVLNRSVQRYIDEYTRNIRDLRGHFFAMYPFFRDMARVLTSYGVPTDFIYLAFAESSFVGYSQGPWQLTKATARSFGLQVNKWVDERLDPLKSTQAAAEYLASLHDLLADWRLTVIAWNTGENSGLPLEDLKHADYSELSEILPRRTRTLLDRFMAVAFIAHHPDMIGVNLAAFTEDGGPSAHCMMTVPAATSLKEAARMAHTTVGVIRALNPALLRDRVPPYESYRLRVPVDTVGGKSRAAAF